MTFEFARVIEHANRICSWQENLGQDEVPPEWMWHLDEEMEVWFEEVEQRRKEKYGGDSDDRTEVPTMTNEYASDVRKK